MSQLLHAIEQDVESGLYDGAVTIVAVGGKVLLKRRSATRTARRQADGNEQRVPRVLDLQIAQRGTDASTG